MRPKTTPTQKKQMINKKNRAHWSNHKQEISTKRKEQLVTLKRLRKPTIEACRSNENAISNELDCLSLNEIGEVIISEDIDDAFSDDDYMHFYVDNPEADLIENQSSIDDQQQDKEPVDDVFREESSASGTDFIDEPTVPEEMRDFDELVSHEIGSIDRCLFLGVCRRLKELLKFCSIEYSIF